MRKYLPDISRLPLILSKTTFTVYFILFGQPLPYPKSCLPWLLQRIHKRPFIISSEQRRDGPFILVLCLSRLFSGSSERSLIFRLLTLILHNRFFYILDLDQYFCVICWGLTLCKMFYRPNMRNFYSYSKKRIFTVMTHHFKLTPDN